MKLKKRVIATILCIIILALSPMASYIDASSVTKVYAASPGVLTAEIMYVICQYFGSVALAYAPIQRTDLPTDEEVLRTGYAVAQYFSNPTASNAELATKAGLVFYDSMGQSYVFGSEALKQTAETDFSVIQGGGNPDDNNDDDDDENKKMGKRLLEFYRAGEVFVATSAILGDYITDKIYDAYSSFVKGEPSLYDDVFADLADQSFTGYDSLQDENGKYFGDVYAYGSTGHTHYHVDSLDYPIYVEYVVTGDTTVYHFRNASNYSSRVSMSGTSVLNTGEVKTFSSKYVAYTLPNYIAVSTNLPIFSSLDEAKAAFETGDFSSALNYTKVYRDADWLSDNWAGTLTDPLTGLNALGDFVNIARHQGLNALGNELTPDDFTDYLRDYFANVGTGLDTYPNFNPALDPIVYDPTGTMPDFTLDPARNPVIQPSTSPGTDPSPGVDPSPSPGVKPGMEINLDEELPSMPSALLPIASNLKYKFPFSIPWDLKYLFDKLSSQEREPPRWVLPFVIESIGLHGELVIDLKDFQVLSDLSRLFLTLLFCLSLINMTMKIVGMRKEE